MTPISNEPFLQVSKWLTCALLVETSELQQLFQLMGHFSIYQVSSLSKKGEEIIKFADFLNTYDDYINEIKNGKIVDEMKYKFVFSSIFTVEDDVIMRIPLQDERQIIRVIKPVIQLQSHKIHYSEIEEKFRSKVFGSETISWGIQFSYPQLFLDQKSQEVIKLFEGERPNTKLFQIIQKWSRNFTIPTPFIVKGKKINVPMRLGKECTPWINTHPQLAEKGIQVEI